MPEQIKQAVEWALQQEVIDETTENTITVDANTPHLLVDKVREYFNERNIVYDSFSYDDLIPYFS